MKLPSLTVRCMAWEEQGMWVAACIDLTLAAQSSTKEGARDMLHEQIASYVREAVSVDAEHAELLLSRRAPVWDRIRYNYWAALNNRPRVRKSLRLLAAWIGNRIAYREPLPISVA